ncbi:MAG: extracellular solute-binding protein [Candidatus Kerfeldbacteria bacterium]
MRKRFSLKTLPVSIAGLFLLLAAVVTTGQLCPGGGDLEPPVPFTMEIWRPADRSGDFTPAVEAYQAVYPHVSFNIRTMDPETYEDELFAAWSKGEGPDIFSVPNWRLGKFREFISPMPQQATLRQSVAEKSFGRTVITVTENTVQFPSTAQVRDRFVDAVYHDAVYEDQIFGLPYSFDTLVMYYNRDLLARAQVAVPPTTWEEFRNAVQAMTQYDEDNKIVQPAAAIGTADNIPYFMDILSSIMMQNGADMVTETGRIDFIGETESGRLAGVEALDFYTKFSDPAFRTYTWDDNQLGALEAFTQGTLGFYFGYYGDRAVIDNRAPNLNYSYAKIPQVDLNNQVNIARYPIEAVHIGSENADHAWNFINYLSQQDQVSAFLDSTGRIPAVKSLIGTKQEDSEIGIFAQQALTAKTWYHGVDPDTTLLAFREMVNEAIAKASPIEEIVALAQRKVSLTFQSD